jgi:DNA-binding NarL/FixJ family response regulator
MSNCRILLVDDHAVVREGVRRLLSDLHETELLEVGSGEEALEMVAKEQPEIVLLDLNLAGLGGLELLRRILAASKDVRVIVFTMHAEPVFAARAMQLGAHGYVSKGAGADELLNAVQRVRDGGHYIEKEIAVQLAASKLAGKMLSNREVEILRLLGEGKSLNGIAEALGIAYKTVANTCTRMKDKLGIQTTAELIRYSLQTRD